MAGSGGDEVQVTKSWSAIASMNNSKRNKTSAGANTSVGAGIFVGVCVGVSSIYNGYVQVQV